MEGCSCGLREDAATAPSRRLPPRKERHLPGGARDVKLLLSASWGVSVPCNGAECGESEPAGAVLRDACSADSRQPPFASLYSTIVLGSALQAARSTLRRRSCWPHTGGPAPAPGAAGGCHLLGWPFCACSCSCGMFDADDGVLDQVMQA